MGAFAFHSNNLRERLADYAPRMGLSNEQMLALYQQMLSDRVLDELPRRNVVRCFISYLDMEPLLQDEQQKRFYVMLRNELPIKGLVHSKKNLPALLLERCLRVWEQIYNIIINKIPIHWVRIAWLRAGGMKIGKGSSVWRNTEIIGMENIVIGDDSVVAWHCQLDGRTGLFIGDHVTLASYVLVIAGGHDPMSPDFSSYGYPIYIDNYAWIASRAILTNGAHIKEGAVIGAQCIVTREIPPYAVVKGMDAEIVGERPRGLNYKVGGRSLFNFLH